MYEDALLFAVVIFAGGVNKRRSNGKFDTVLLGATSRFWLGVTLHPPHPKQCTRLPEGTAAKTAVDNIVVFRGS